MKRTVSLFLIFAIILAMIPAFTFGVTAATDGTLSESDLVSDDIKLGKGFNVLAGKQLLKENVSTNVIFEDPTFLSPCVSGASRTEYYYSYINDANSYLKNQSSKLDADIDVAVQISMVSVDASVKYGLETANSSSGSENKEYIALSAVASRKKYYYRTLTSDDKKALWNTTGVLSEDFKEAISSLQTNGDIAAFFAKYGTHIIMAYAAGGEACYTYSGEKVEAAESMSVDENVSVSAGVSVGSFGSVKASVDSANHMDSSGTSSSTNVSAYGYQKGGVGIPFKDTDVTAWEQTISDSSMEILVNSSLQMIPIWDLLVEDSQADLKARLKSYFEEQLGTGNTGVDNLMGKTDYSDYTFVTNAQELDAIRNDLTGKYVLLCDIDLSEYTQWAPIGASKEEPFAGVLDGNGNSVIGLNVTQAVNGAAGLFGYIGPSGEVRNLTVDGTIAVDVTGADDAVGYVGGIAGYSSGIIQNCRNYVRANGTLTADTSAVEDKAERTWFEINNAQIEEAKSTAAITAEDGAVYSTFPLKLTGSGKNITISVPDSGKTAYIILEDAQITGTISSVSGNTRSVCIISMGSGNTFVAPNDAIAVNVPNASLYITGDAPLSVQGGTGSNGANGAAAVESSNKNGTSGSNGENGKNGAAGIAANQLIIHATSIRVSGGDGGNGGHASNGTNGKNVTGTCKSDYATSSWCRGAVGGNGGAGGAGGNGGNGAVPVSVNGITAYGESKLVMLYGKNGDGGNGGNGGNGGCGQNGANGWCVAGIEPGHAGGHGGTGGNGGNGGSAGKVELFDYSQIATLFQYSNIIVDKTQIFSGIGGTGGVGGAGGSGGTGGAEIHNWFYDIGQHPGVAGNGGNGGAGGNGGNGGNGYVNGAGANAGAGGAAGSRGKTEDNCGKNGTSGSKGNGGIAGVKTILDGSTSEAFLITNAKEYNIYAATAGWDAVHTLLNGGELVSIGSQKEQQLIEQLIGHASGSRYWIGLYRNSEKGFNIFDWDDGTTLKIQEGTFGSDAVASLLGSNNEEICSTYSNWAPSQPDNINSSEKYIYMNATGTWYDTGADNLTVDGYITEETLMTESANSKNKNILFAGGICGFADTESEITGCINYGKVAGNVTSEEYGVTACSGGIAGVNYGSIRNCVSTGAVEAISISKSAVEYSDAYAAQIANIGGSGASVNCYSDVKPVAYAISGSGLSNPNSKKDSTADATFVQELEAVWSSDKLRITSVNSEKTTYSYGDVFDKNSITVIYNGIKISRFKVNYYFKDGATSANVVISYEDAVRILPVKLKPDTHSPTDVWSNDEMHHWKECIVAGCGVVIEESKAPHSSDRAENKATCQKQAVCDVCGVAYGEIASHSYTAKDKKSDALKTEGNCRDNAVYYYSCSVCGLVENDDNHTFSGDKVATTHVGGTTVVNASEPNQTNQQIGYTGDTKCLGCGEIISYGHSYQGSYNFPDVPKSLWCYDAVQFAVGKGYFSGYKSGNFGPADSITRQDFVVVMARIAGVDLSKYSGRTGFPDVKPGDYYEAAVKWASTTGVVMGYNNGKFGVGDKITREQLVTILYRYAQKTGCDTSVPSSAAAKLNAYTDAGKITPYAKTAVIWALHKGVISGMTSTTIAPQNNASRGQVATILMNISKKGVMPI